MDSDFKQPTLELYFLIHNAKNYNEIEPLRLYLAQNNCLSLYKKMIEKNILQYNKEDLKIISEEIDRIVANSKQEESKESDNDSNILKIKKKLCEFYAQTLDLDNFRLLSNELMETDKSLSLKMDIYLCFIRIAIILNDRDLLDKNVIKANDVFESTCDWDRKNRFKVYLGLYKLLKGEFKESAEYFNECLKSFDAKELLPFDKVIFYLIFVTLLGCSRSKIKTYILDNSEVRKSGISLKLAECFFDCNYQFYFKALLGFIESFSKDAFISVLQTSFCKELKIKAYNQLITSYQSLHINKMAEVFNISPSDLENELVEFINEGRVNCVIDRVDMAVHVTVSKDTSYYVNIAMKGNRILKGIKKSAN